METTWHPCQNHMVSTYKQHAVYMQTMQCTPGKHMVSIHGNHIVSTWKPHGVYADMWFLCGHNIVTTWTSHGSQVNVIWFPCGYHVLSMCTPCAFHGRSIWSLNGEGLRYG